MEYYQARLHPGRQASVDLLVEELSRHGKWAELSDNQLAEFIVEVERFRFLPIIEQSWMLSAFRMGPFTLGIFAWKMVTHIAHTSRQTDTLHLLLHVHPTVHAGHVMLRPETLADKFNELFNRVELDFAGDRLFSRKHYVLADEPAAAERLLTQEVRHRLNTIRHLSLESIGGCTLLAPMGTAQPADIEPLLHAGRAIAATA